MKTLKCQVTIGTVTSKRDLSLGFRVETPELTPTEKVAFMELQNNVLEMTLRPLDDPEAVILPITTKKAEQSHSARLRSVIYVLYKQKVESGVEVGDFDSYYAKIMEAFINKVKDQLEE